MIRILIGLVLCVATGGTSLAQTPGHSEDVPTLDPAAVEVFADSFFTNAQASWHLPGAVVVVVQDSARLFSRGYGYAEVQARVSVDPARTLFQVASVSKVVTATAVMQLVAEGRIDVNADVNTYLRRVVVPEAFGRPVTPAHLLTHTAGFDDRIIGYAAPNPEGVLPLEAYLAERLPPRTLPPGAYFSYSNHGMALAGLLVEDVSGQSFADYVEARVLEPLGMTNSTFRFPPAVPPAAQVASCATCDTGRPPLHLAAGYRWDGTAYREQPTYYRQAPPAGSLVATGDDMARFLFLHLGAVEDAGILSNDGIARMHAPAYVPHPLLPGFAYGLALSLERGVRVLHHAGTVPGFDSLLLLMPDQDIGVFVAVNANNSTWRKAFVDAFLERFLPVIPAQPVAVSGEAPGHLEAYAGSYRLNRFGRRSIERLLSLFRGGYQVTLDSAGVLVTPDGVRWTAVNDSLFRRVDDASYLMFRKNARGNVTHLFYSETPGAHFPAVYERLAWYETPRFVNEFYLSWLIFILFTVVAWPIAAPFGVLGRRLRNRPAPARPVGARWARGLALLFTASVLAFGFGFLQEAVQQFNRGSGPLLFGLEGRALALVWLPSVEAVLLPGLIAGTGIAWRRSYWGPVARVHYTLVTVAALIWVVFLAAYHFIPPAY